MSIASLSSTAGNFEVVYFLGYAGLSDLQSQSNLNSDTEPNVWKTSYSA